MIEIYVLGAGALAILLLFSYAKSMSFKAKAAEVIAKESADESKSKDTVIAQKEKTVDAVIATKEILAVKQKDEQIKIDSGLRNNFSEDSF